MKKIISKRNILFLSLILIGGIIIGSCFLLFHNAAKPDSEVEQGTVNYNSKFKKVATGNIIFPAYTEDLFLKKKENILPILLVNPLANKNIYLQYKISITEGNKKNICLGETKLIKSGKALKNLTVDSSKIQDLQPNTYPCRIDVYAYNYNTKNKKRTNLNQAYWDVKFHLEK